jgi:hypothetical protein
MTNHELFDFLKQSSDAIQTEYERIARRSGEDPGTAGDEGEQNWQKILSDWLPPAYQVVTKGRLLFSNGKASRQLDVLVLSPEYPKGLAASGKKLYLAGGVIAAFECKLTLRQHHIKEAFENSRVLANGLGRRWGSPYRELHTPVIYGLLAHSSEWKSPGSQPTENVQTGLNSMVSSLDHPLQMLDLVCVSDVGTWTATKCLSGGRNEVDGQGAVVWRPTVNPVVYAGYALRHRSGALGSEIPFTNVGAMVVDVLTRISRGRGELRPVSGYFNSVPGLAGDAEGIARTWTFHEVFSGAVEAELTRLDSQAPETGLRLIGSEDKGDVWSEWHHIFSW